MMLNNAFCTIITNNYFSWALTLYDSLQKYDENITLFVAIVDEKIEDHSNEIGGKNIKILTVKDFKGIILSKEILEKYSTDRNILRWALKPILLLKCLEHSRKVIFVDADIYFFSDYHFLFDQLDVSRVLLTPHWRPLTPTINKVEFSATFKHGVYNAGFIAVNCTAQKVLNYWAESCYIFCGLDDHIGLYYDQTYLNLFPIYFEDVHILRHLGCNVANWNMEICKRTENPITKEVLINEQYPIIFIHFTNVTIDNILRGRDPLLIEFLLAFNTNLIENGFKNIIENRKAYFAKLEKDKNDTKKINFIKKVKKIYYKIRYRKS